MIIRDITNYRRYYIYQIIDTIKISKNNCKNDEMYQRGLRNPNRYNIFN